MNKATTIRRDKESRKISISTEPDILSDDRIKFIIENMTRRNARILKDFQKGRSHPPFCVCWLCLWRKYEKVRLSGHPYDYTTFLAYDIMEEVFGPFQYEPIKKIPIKMLAREVIQRLPIIHPDTKKILNRFTRDLFRDRFIEYSRKKRYQSDSLQNLIEQLMYQIHREGGRYVPAQEFGPKAIRGLRPSGPKAIHILRPSTRALLPSKIAQYIYSQPDHKATQRELQRLTNKRKADLEETHEWLKWRYGIITPPHKKWESTIYIGTEPKFPRKPPGRRLGRPRPL